MSQARIRPATAADSPAVVAVVRAVHDEYGFTWDPDDYHADLYDIGVHYLGVGHRFYVAEVGDEVVGCAALEVFAPVAGALGEIVEQEGTSRIGGSDCALQRLYVHPEARRAGIGTRLFERTLDAAVETGRTAMEIWSDKKLTKSHRLYERLGARRVADRVCDDPDQSPEWGFLLEIDHGRRYTAAP